MNKIFDEAAHQYAMPDVNYYEDRYRSFIDGIKWHEEYITEHAYTGGQTAGQVAKRVGVSVGMLGCPHCGTVVHGAITENKCTWCDEPFFPEHPKNENFY